MARVAPSWGGEATSGAEALWGRETMAGMAQGGLADGNRLDGEVGYGLPVGSRFVGTPRVGFSTSEYGRDYRVAYSLVVLDGEGTAFELGVDAQRRERPMVEGADNGVLWSGHAGLVGGGFGTARGGDEREPEDFGGYRRAIRAHRPAKDRQTGRRAGRSQWGRRATCACKITTADRHIASTGKRMLSRFSTNGKKTTCRGWGARPRWSRPDLVDRSCLGLMDRGCFTVVGKLTFPIPRRGVWKLRAPGVLRPPGARVGDTAPGALAGLGSGYAAGRSVPPRGRLSMKSSTSCSTQRTARRPMRIGFGNVDSAIIA